MSDKNMLNVDKHVRYCVIIMGMLGLLAGCAGTRSDPVKMHPQQASQVRSYTVQRGDTLYAISVKYDMDYREIAKLNHLGDPAHIKAGMHLVLQEPVNTHHSLAPKDRLRKLPPSAAMRSEKSGQTPELSQSGRQKEYGVKNTAEATASDKIEWQWPAKGEVINGFSDRPLGNKGIDISGKRGEPVLAAADGSVVYVGSGLVGYGRMVIIRHGDRYLSVYAHNEELLVHEGDKVRSGQVIARLGESGTSRFELHFEIRRAGHPVNPEHLLPRSIHQAGL